MACVYSLRARSRPTVSMPVHWREVEQAVEAKDASRLVYTADTAIERIEREGDIFKEVMTLRQELPADVRKRSTPSTSTGPKALETYREKHDFSATPEPAGGRSHPHQRPIFVIQRHAAKRLHYDLRLEVEGVLKSWSVPRGPSSNPSDRRLAVQVEDHPWAYQEFEGVIPKGQYGAGRVTIWDHGSYRNITGDPQNPVPMSQAIEDGKVEVFFEGNHIKGGYALIRMHTRDEDKTNWLLIKLKDEYVGSLPDDLEE